MSKVKVSGGGSGMGLVTLISGIWAYVATPSFTGVQGVLAAAMVGGGTSTVSGLCAIGGGVAGAAFGAAAGALGGKAKVGAAVGLVVGGVGGGLYGIPQGYHYAHDIAVNGMASKLPQNNQAQKVTFQTPGISLDQQ